VDFLEWQRKGTLDLNPYYQRRSVWNPRVKSLLLDSVLRGYPLPLIFLHNRVNARESTSTRQIVDGQQRLRTLLAYIDIDSIPEPDDWDDFTILKTHNSEYGGLRFKQLPHSAQRLILQTALSVNVLPSDISDVTILRIFQRMNTTGLKLTEQEVRNGTYFGEFKEASYELAYEQNQRWTSWGLFERQEIAQMREVEYTSDLIGALIHGVSARSTSAINTLYKEYDAAFPARLILSDQFRSIFDQLAIVFDQNYLPNRFRSTAWFYPLFCVAAGLSDSGRDPKNESPTDLPPSPDNQLHAYPPEDLIYALGALDEGLASRGQLPETVVEAMRRQTTHLAGRLQRIRLIRAFLR
jgi:hypothetical protein